MNTDLLPELPAHSEAVAQAATETTDSESAKVY